MSEIQKYISDNNLYGLVEYFKSHGQPSTAELLYRIIQTSVKKQTSDQQCIAKEVIKKPRNSSTIRVMLMCNWCESKKLCDMWNKMSQGSYTWNNIQIVWEEPADYFVVINCPPITVFPLVSKTLLFHMEPHMDKNHNMWGDWGIPTEKSFKFCGTHKLTYNNIEWHMTKTYNQLSTENIEKTEGLCLSTVLSGKYSDTGHIKRIDFIKFLEKKDFDVDVYGDNKFSWKQYKGSLPYHCKDKALLPYKYVFNAENNEIKNYFTEKLIDGILSECLVFYWGCPNIRQYIDPRAFVQLELSNFENDYNVIKESMLKDLWSERIPYIREAKKKILNELQFFPRIEKLLTEH